MANVVIELTGKEASLVRAWQRSKESVDEFNRAMDSAGAKGNKTGGFLADMGVKFASGLTTTVSAVGALTAAAALLKSEYDGMVQRQNAALGTQVTYAKAQRAAVDNFMPDATMGVKEYQQTNLNIAKETKASPLAVLNAAGRAMSAKGAMSNADAMAAVKEVLAFNPGDAEGAAAIAPGVVSLMNAYKYTPQEAFGFLQGVKGTSRIETDQDLGTKAATAISQQVAWGDSAQHAGALYSYLSNKMGDFTGGRTDTAMLQLSQQLEAAMPNMKDTEERIAFMRSDSPEAAAMREELLGKIENDMRVKGTLHGEASAFVPVRQLLSPEQNEGNSTYDAMLSQQVSKEDAPNYLKERKRAAESSDIQKLAFKKLSADTDKELSELGQTDSGNQARIRQDVEGMLNSANITGVERKLLNTEYAAREFTGDNPAYVAAEVMESVAKKLENEFENGGAGPKKSEKRLNQDKTNATELRRKASEFRGEVDPDSEESHAYRLDESLKKAGTGSFRRSVVIEEFRRKIQEEGASVSGAFTDTVNEEVDHLRSANRRFYPDAIEQSNTLLDEAYKRAKQPVGLTDDQKTKDIADARNLISQAARLSGRTGDEGDIQTAFTEKLTKSKDRNPLEVYADFADTVGREFEREGDDKAAEHFRGTGRFAEQMEDRRNEDRRNMEGVEKEKPTETTPVAPSPTAPSANMDRLADALERNTEETRKANELAANNLSVMTTPQVPRPRLAEDLNRR